MPNPRLKKGVKKEEKFEREGWEKKISQSLEHFLGI